MINLRDKLVRAHRIKLQLLLLDLEQTSAPALYLEFMEGLEALAAHLPFKAPTQRQGWIVAEAMEYLYRSAFRPSKKALVAAQIARIQRERQALLALLPPEQ